MASAHAASRFPEPRSRTASKMSEGSRGPSELRVRTSVSCGMLPRTPTGNSSSPMGLSGGILCRSASKLKKRQTIDISELDRPTSPARIAAQQILEANKGFTPKGHVEEYCYICSGLLKKTGHGLKLCVECRACQLASGHVSHIASGDPVLPSTEELVQASNAGTGLVNGLHTRQTWRRLSAQAIVDKYEDKSVWGPVPDAETGEDADIDHPKPVMAGFVHTGYFVGDKVRTTVRLPGGAARSGWDPMKTPTNEAYVLGPGNDAGEIMVRFEHNGVNASLKMSQLEHWSAPAVRNNVERNIRRKSTFGEAARRSSM